MRSSRGLIISYGKAHTDIQYYFNWRYSTLFTWPIGHTHCTYSSVIEVTFLMLIFYTCVTSIIMLTLINRFCEMRKWIGEGEPPMKSVTRVPSCASPYSNKQTKIKTN